MLTKTEALLNEVRRHSPAAFAIGDRVHGYAVEKLSDALLERIAAHNGVPRQRRAKAAARPTGEAAAGRRMRPTALVPQPDAIAAARDEGRREGEAEARAELNEVLRAAETVGLSQVEAVTLYTEVGSDAALDLIRRHGSRALEQVRWDQDASAGWERRHAANAALRAAARSEPIQNGGEPAARVVVPEEPGEAQGSADTYQFFQEEPLEAVYARRARQARGE